MKILVSMIQLVIIAAIILPILTFWQTDKVDKFCKQLTPGMSQENYLKSIQKYNLKLVEMVGNDVASGQWYATVKTHIPLLEYQCQTKGVSQLLVTAEIVKSLEPDSAELDSD